MSAEVTVPAWAQRLVELRRARLWVEADLARELKNLRPDLPAVKSLTHMVRHDWETGAHKPGPRYRMLLAAVFDVTEAELFADTEASLWRPPGLSEQLQGAFTPDDEDRLTLAAVRPGRVDLHVVEDLATILAAQRRLEDTIGSASLLAPMTTQMHTITGMIRDAAGPHRDALLRLAAEWAAFTGWLYAATRQDDQALALFGRAEEMADEVGDGVIAAMSTSFRGYVARQRGRYRGVVRASCAALATPGAAPAQRTFDTLQAAQGHAGLGDVDQARRFLDQAVSMTDSSGDPPPPVYWYSGSFFRLNIGMVQAAIGEYRDAAEMIGNGLEGIPGEQRGAEWLAEYRAAMDEARDRS